MLDLKVQKAGPWEMYALHFSPEAWSFGSYVIGAIGNSVTDGEKGRRRTAEWKISVATGVRTVRPSSRSGAPERYSITLGFAFHPASHGNQKLDVENYMKPTLDAIACGLFASNELDLATVAKWHFDDARFAHLLVHRLPDVASSEEEGAAFFVSTR